MYRYYSFRQFPVMRLKDPMAKMRPPKLEDHDGTHVCVVCGSTDRFYFKAKQKGIVTVIDGQLRVSLAGRMSKWDDLVPIEELLDEAYEHGSEPVLACARCHGPVSQLKLVRADCEKYGCLGCLLCGKVTSASQVEKAISGCWECRVGDTMCNSACQRRFMRHYHEFDVKYFKKVEDEDDWRTSSFSGRTGGLNAILPVLPEVREL